LHDDDTIGKIKDDQIISDFRVRSIERIPNTAWGFIVFGVKEVHRVHNGAEVTDRIVAKYTIRLAEQPRTETHPSGLLIAQYFEELMTGDRDTGLAQDGGLETK
ncbi:MAG TPA: hypothetical protein VKZ53_23740, partial [Candidatus Angelobacter sp.]|nr:hypothetical protein [Candidatus Angelobacter sp.]